jgi:hypothetical protein
MLCVLEFLITCRIIPTEECLSKRLTGGILTVPIGNGEVREYRLTKRSRDGATKYYRCSKCSSLHRKLKTGILATVIVKNGVVPLEQPQHHPGVLFSPSQLPSLRLSFMSYHHLP